MKIEIQRKYPKADYTIGLMTVDGKIFCDTLELPWRDNQQNISCIPEGRYDVRLTYSQKFGRVLPLVMNVPGRSGIRIHAANKPEEITGCIAVGENTKKGMVLNSRKYDDLLVRLLKESESRGEFSTLTIK